MLAVALPVEPFATSLHFMSKFDNREDVLTDLPLSIDSFKLTFDWSRFGSPVLDFNTANSLYAFYRFFLA